MKYPRAPSHTPGFLGSPGGGLSENKPARYKKKAYRMKTQHGNADENGATDGRQERNKSRPCVRSDYSSDKIRAYRGGGFDPAGEGVKVDDPENCPPFRDVEPGHSSLRHTQD